MFRKITLCGLALGAVIFAGPVLTSPAYAADTTSALAPLLDMALQVAALVLAAVVPVLVTKALNRLNKLLGVSFDEKQRRLIDDVLSRAINLGVEQARGKLSGAPVELKAAVIKSASEYAIERIPDALAHFNVTPDALDKMIEARLKLAPKAA